MIDPNKKPVDAIQHQSDSRTIIPTSELAGEEAMNVADMPKESAYDTFRHEFVRGRDPELYWLNKYRNDDDLTQDADLRVDIRSLYVHENIAPEMLIKRLYQVRQEQRNNQPMLFSPEDLRTEVEDQLDRVADYYTHSMGWKNRLIQGDSLLVMNSLLNREGMAGKVQCIYIDPPYGIKYGSNWQMKLNSRDVKDNDESLSGEPEMIKAFRDTWELGIHSYLSYLRDRLVLARELLTQSGSVFVQISDENVHLVRNLLDEVFGSENFVSQIVYKKTSGAGSPGELQTIASVCDYILWYAKDKSCYKYNKLYLPQVYGENTEAYKFIELSDKTRMSIREWETLNGQKLTAKNIPAGAKIFRLGDLTSQTGAESIRYAINFEGKEFRVNGTRGWRTSQEGMQRVISANRVVSLKNTLGYVLYLQDFPLIELNNFWVDTSSSVGADKLYVVQSAIKPIQRCILMTTDPGDLVLDPTCGSGTTAFVAEQWGRRWITIDTSRIALNIAKTRLTTALFPYYELFDKENGNIRQGFVYKTVPHITLKSIANDLEPHNAIIYDQPFEDKKRIRVSGPFTVETLQSMNVASPESVDDRPNEAEENRLFQERIFSHLQTAGIRNGDKTQRATFHSLEPVSNPYLHARGYYTDAEGEERLVYFHIGPKFGTVSRLAVGEAVKAMRSKAQKEGASWLVLLGFSFEDSINDADYNMGLYTVSKVRMHDDLMQEGLLKKDKGAGSFITIGEPDIAIVKDDEIAAHVEIRGLDIYDPIKDDVKARSVEDIAYWEIDDDYDEEQFIVREIHFCGGTKKEYDAWKKGLNSIASAKTKKKAETTLRLILNDEVWDTLYDFRSSSFEARPGRKICVRVVSQFGEESSKVLTVE